MLTFSTIQWLQYVLCEFIRNGRLMHAFAVVEILNALNKLLNVLLSDVNSAHMLIHTLIVREQVSATKIKLIDLPLIVYAKVD